MLSLSFYKMLHLSGLFILMMSLGALCFIPKNTFDPQQRGTRKLLAALNGIAALVVFVAGFGMMAKLKIHPWPLWFYYKVFVWIMFSMSPFFAKLWSPRIVILFYSFLAVLTVYVITVKPF